MGLTTEAKVGLVILAAFLFLAYMTLTVGGTRWGTPKGYRLEALFDTAAGLDDKSTVKLAGVDIGQVESIRLEGNRARVTIRIKPDVQIRRDARASLKATGLLGEKYMEIIPGEGPGFVEEGETMEQAEEAADLDGLVSRLSSIADDVKAVSVSLRDAFGTEEGGRSLKEILANFESFSAEMDSIAARLEQGEGTLGMLMQDEEIYHKLNSTLDSLDKMSKKLEKGEGTIGKLMTDEKAYNELTGALEGLGNSIKRFERTKVYLGYRGEYQTRESDTKGYFSIQLEPRDDKFYLFELVDDPRGEVTRTVTQVDSGPPVTTLKSKSKLEFTALFGKRFGPLTVRGGMMENSAGIGADYSFFGNRLQFSFDAWDFNSDDPQEERAHLKATGRLMPFKYVYIQGGYDNFLNRDIDTYFIGGGIRIEDEDLKYLIGGMSAIR